MTAALRAQLSRRIRGATPKEWSRFSTLWMAFNAIYGGEPDARERSRAMSAVCRHLSESRAKTLLQECDVPVDRILAVPPGDMQLDRWDPRFRRASRELARAVLSRAKARVRLAAMAGILYQVRCNLIHGSKDPQEQRDRMLVKDSVRILELLVPALEDGAGGV